MYVLGSRTSGGKRVGPSIYELNEPEFHDRVARAQAGVMRAPQMVFGLQGLGRAGAARPAAGVRRAERGDAAGIGDVHRGLPGVRGARAAWFAGAGGRDAGA